MKRGVQVSDKEKNVTNVRESDKRLINDLMSLPPDKKCLIEGILLGFGLAESRKRLVMAE